MLRFTTLINGRSRARVTRPVVDRRFESVAEALSGGEDVRVACAVVGQELARDGADLGEALSGLADVTARVVGKDPSFEAVRALSLAWAEETLGYVNDLSCENPMTGLASQPHLRARISEVIRAADHRGESAATTHCLVVMDLPAAVGADDRFERALFLAHAGEVARAVFAGGETVSHVGHGRVVTLAHRTTGLGGRVAELRSRAAELGPLAQGARVWIEGLPGKEWAAASLLDELAR